MKLAMMVAVLVLFATPAIAAECILDPLPTVPVNPTFGMDVQSTSTDWFRIDLWRQPCQAGSETLLIRITPITAAPFVCGPNFHFVQDGVQYAVFLRTSFSTISSFCDNLFAATTFVPVASTGPPPLDITQAFSLVYSTLFTLDVPAEGGPATAPPSLTLIATGCTTCHPGNLVAYEIHVTNPGRPVLVELKTGVRLPNGSTASILGRHLEQSFPTGTTVIPLVSAVLPSGLPSGTYTIEAAILELELGVTISRDRAPLAILP